MSIRHIKIALVTMAVWTCSISASAQSAEPGPAVHIIWMGASDCPPCEAWRREELPKLKTSPEFARITYSYVVKVIKSPVPPRFFLPEEVKPYKDKLDHASAGRIGSPQVAIMVNAEVYDYFFGTRTAEEFERMLVALRSGGKYPFKRCTKVSTQWGKCDVAS